MMLMSLVRTLIKARRVRVMTTFYVILMTVEVKFVSSSAPAANKLQALTYLTKFGYVGCSSNEKGCLITDDYIINKAIIDFQRFAGLNHTGILDESTMTMMNMPRCGVKDKVGRGSQAKRKKRYALQGSKWRVRELTYRISKYPASSKLSRNEVDQEIKRGFEVWSEQTNLKFIPLSTSGRVHIDVRFGRGEHGDGDPFDGAGGTLAHAYFPIYGGDAHFDDAERWTINSYRGSNLFQVAAHEFGHSLGLSHSDVKAALMAPFYRGYQAKFQLNRDDVRAIQSLYGTKRTEKPRPNPRRKPSPTRGPGRRFSNSGSPEEGELCSDSTIDAMFSVGKRSYAFKGDYYWELTSEGLADGYPRAIKMDWIGLPSNIDAAFTYTDGKTYFFKDFQYWCFTGMKLDDTYPRPIKQGFMGVPDKVDAAFLWGGNDKVYFFKGTKYWKFDQSHNPPVSSNYPKPISSWNGIPDNIDAAFRYTNGYTYFFKGSYYWRFNDRQFAVDKAKPTYPRSSAIWWFGCKAMFSDNNRGSFSFSGLSMDSSEDHLEVDSQDDFMYQLHPDGIVDPMRTCGSAGSSSAVNFSQKTLVVSLAIFTLTWTQTYTSLSNFF